MAIEILPEETSTLISVHQIIPTAYILLKELIENSIDAQASAIKVGVHGENEKITYSVQDNGKGIEVNEHFLALGGTSKGKDATYGCKGVAINSIIQLSNVFINTRTALSSASTEVTITNGAIVKRKSYRPEAGTTVKVAAFHAGTPVRHAYILKNLSTYLKDIVVLAKKYAILHGIKFTIERNTKTLFTSTAIHPTCRLQRLLTVYMVHKALGTLQLHAPGFVIEAVILDGLPVAEGIIYAQDKLLESSKVLSAISGLSKTLQRKMLFYMHITQVHPEEVSGLYNVGARSNKHTRLIYKEALIIKEIEDIAHSQEMQNITAQFKPEVQVKEFIEGAQIKYTWSINTCKEDIQTPANTLNSTATSLIPSTLSPTPPTTPKKHQMSQSVIKPYIPAPPQHITTFVINTEECLTMHTYTEGLPLKKDEISKLQVVGQFNKGFIIATLQRDSNTHIYAIDQHSADEAVNYERLKVNYAQQTRQKQRLIQPIPLALSEYDRYLAEECKDSLKSHGFMLSLGKDQLIEVPVYDSTAFGEPELKEVLEALKENRTKQVLFSSLRKMFASKACRSSIMIGDPLTLQTMKEILENLSKTTRPWNCPHGRPTIILLHSS